MYVCVSVCVCLCVCACVKNSVKLLNYRVSVKHDFLQ